MSRQRDKISWGVYSNAASSEPDSSTPDPDAAGSPPDPEAESGAAPFNWALSAAATRGHCSFAQHVRTHLVRPRVGPGQDLTLGCNHVFRWVQDQRLKSDDSVETVVLFVNGRIQLPAR